MLDSRPGIGPHLESDASDSEDKSKRSAELRSSLILIQSRPLNPDTIDTYAEDALTDLISLSASVAKEYRKTDASFMGFGRDLEDSAFKYFGLDNLGEVLGYVAQKDAEIKRIGQIVEKAQNTGQVIVPPDQIDPPTGNGNGEFKKKTVISRTKAVLFILSNDFDVDLNDPEEFSIKTGALTDNMMRKQSYFMISIPKLNRTILCCDEEGNVTYVFDNKILKDRGISPEDLAELSKSGINNLISADVKLGGRVVYSSKFVPRMIGIMTDIELKRDSVEPQGLYLMPALPEGYVSGKEMSKRFRIDKDTIYNAVTNLKDELGIVGTYRIVNTYGRAYSPEQQRIIIEYLERRGNFAPQAPEGFISAGRFCAELGIGNATLEIAISALKDNLGKIESHRFGPTFTSGYSPEQQKEITKYLEENGFIAHEIPEGFESIISLAKRLSVSSHTVYSAVEKIGESLGKIESYRFANKLRKGNTLGKALAPNQQELLINYLRETHVLVDPAPEGVLSATGLAELLGIGQAILYRELIKMGDILGKVDYFKFTTISARGYTPDQQEIIRQRLREKGLLK
jgi:hypothetical protein